MAYDNTNRGMLAKNKNRQNDRQPQYKGSINVDGVEYWLSAWVKEAIGKGKMEEGEKFFSIAVEPKEKKKEDKKPAQKRASTFDDEDDIPFR